MAPNTWTIIRSWRIISSYTFFSYFFRLNYLTGTTINLMTHFSTIFCSLRASGVEHKYWMECCLLFFVVNLQGIAPHEKTFYKKLFDVCVAFSAWLVRMTTDHYEYQFIYTSDSIITMSGICLHYHVAGGIEWLVGGRKYFVR